MIDGYSISITYRPGHFHDEDFLKEQLAESIGSLFKKIYDNDEMHIAGRTYRITLTVKDVTVKQVVSDSMISEPEFEHVHDWIDQEGLNYE